MSPTRRRADTVVLIHGMWMTALSWENWIRHYTDKGYRVIAKSWPGMDGDIEKLRHDPAPIAKLGIGEIVDHYEAIVRAVDRPPIIIGHSIGGLMTQVLLDRGLGAAGVAIAPAGIKGVLFLPLSTIRKEHRAIPLTPKQFHYAFTNHLSEKASLAIFRRYAVAGPDHLLFQAGFANFNPRAASAVDVRNHDRAPLLLVAGGDDHVSPPPVVEANARLYGKSRAITEYREFPGRTHFVLGQPGWEEVADYALDWAVARTSKLTHADMRLRPSEAPRAQQEI